MPQVSVVIPCFAQAHFLSDAIESVLAQTHTDYEIIVIDDGSPDNVREVVERFPGVRLIAQENRGLSQARNRGLAECTGTYVVCLDADGVLGRSTFRALTTPLDARVQGRPRAAGGRGLVRRRRSHSSVSKRNRE